MTRDDRSLTDDAAPAKASRAAIAAAALAVVLVAVFLAVFLSRFPPATLAIGRALRPSVAAAVVLLAAYASGGLALRLAGAIFRRIGRLEDGGERPDSVSTLLVGLPALGTAVALLAWTGVAIQLSVALLTLSMAVAGAVLLARRRPRLAGVEAADVVLLGPPIALALVGALSPVNSPDELVYKLAVPKAYLLFGGMMDFPLNSNSYFTTALSLVSLAALAISGGVAAKLVHLAIFVAGVVTVRRLADRLAPGSGVWAAAVLAWTPALLLVAGWAWSEWGVLALLFLSYRGWLELQERRSAGAAALITASLAGAAAIKYTALPWIAVFAAIASVRIARRGLGSAENARRPRLAPLLTAATVVMAVLGGFFYLRNWIWSGSPVAPFLLADAPEVEHYRSQGALSGWQELLLGYDIVHSGVVDDALGVLLPACALLAPFAALRHRDARDLLWIGLVPLPFLVALSPMSRLILTSVAPLAVVGAAFLAPAWRAIRSALARVAAAAVAGVALLAQLGLVLYVIVTSHDPLEVLVGAETDAAYVERMRSYAKAYRWVAENTDPRSRVLVIGDNRPYALERAAYSAGNFDGERMARFLGSHSDASALLDGLHRLGITHLVVHWPWLRVEGRAGTADMLEREYVLPLPRATAAMLQDFVDQVATRRYQDDAYSVYELPPADGARPPR